MDGFQLANIAYRIANLSAERIAILQKKYREDKGHSEWALMDHKGKRVLKWFGTEKPSKERVQKEERRIQFFKHQGSSRKAHGTDCRGCGGTALYDDWSRSCICGSCGRTASEVDRDAPEYDSVEDFVQYLMDDDKHQFSHEDLAALNYRLKKPVQSLKKELESYGLSMLTREPEKKVRGISDNPHGTSPFSGMSGGAAYQSVIDSKYGRNPFEEQPAKPDSGFRKPYSAT